jgi:hypothetical protein
MLELNLAEAQSLHAVLLVCNFRLTWAVKSRGDSAENRPAGSTFSDCHLLVFFLSFYFFSKAEDESSPLKIFYLRFYTTF